MGRARLLFESVHHRLFDRLSLLAPERQGKVLRLYFQRKHRKPDAWGHAVEPYEAFKYGKTLDCVPSRPYRRIVDIGCSEGTFTCRVAEAYPSAEIVGVDISERALTRAKKRAEEVGPRVAFAALDILNESPRGTFDLAFCSETLYYLGNNERLRLACARVTALLEPGGLLVVVHPWPESRRLCRFLDASPTLVRYVEYVDDNPRRPFAVTLYERPPRSRGTYA